MRIEGLGVVILAVWIVYLLWKNHYWNGVVNEYDQIFKELKRKKDQESRCLWNLLTTMNQKTLGKVAVAKRKKILTEQAEAIIDIALCTTYENAWTPGSNKTKVSDIEGDPLARVDKFYGSHLSKYIGNKKAAINELYECIENKIK